MAQIIHIGYPKTGSSWLQKELLTHVMGYFKLIKDPILKNITHPLNTTEQLVNIFNNYSKIENLIISDEDLVTQKPEHVKPEEKAKRLHLLFPNATVIIFIRNQMEILPSAYDQYIKGGGSLKFKDYIYQLILSNKIDHWHYHKIIGNYISLFGRNNVKIFLSEELKSNNEFIKDFLRSFDLELSHKPDLNKMINIGLTAVIRNTWRFFNLFTRHQIYSSFPRKRYIMHVPGLFTFNKYFFPFINRIFYPFASFKRNKLFTQEIKNELINLFKKSNYILLKEYKLCSILKYDYLL